MARKILNEVMAYAKSTKGRVITSWEAHLPYRENLLKSLCNPSEKGSLRLFIKRRALARSYATH